MVFNIWRKMKTAFSGIKLSRKIQLALLMIIAPLFIVFIVLFASMFTYSHQYDRIIENAAKASSFSIEFKEQFDHKLYLIIAGHSNFSSEQPYKDINEAHHIALGLIDKTSLKANKERAEGIIKLLDNLEKYVRRIEKNKLRIGSLYSKHNYSYYDDSIYVWENYVQLTTSLITTEVLEFVYYEMNSMEQVRAQMSASLGHITLISLIGLAILVVAAIALSLHIPNSIAKPIYHLRDVTNQVAQGDLSARVSDVQGPEVSKLGKSLNSMIEKIQQLLHAVETDQANLRVAELELLQAQINPHFLYNTLDTIIWLAEAGKHQEVVAVVGSLSDFFRTSLNHGNGMFTLREEERHVRSYMEIQQVRYQDILNYQINIPEELKDAVLPKITLQPIVENALYHGVKNRRSKGMIRISASREADAVVINIEDDGIGMTPERLEKVRKRLHKKANDDQGAKRDSYGLYNVNERIKLKFGDRYGLEIFSVYGEGTCVKVRIPLISANR